MIALQTFAFSGACILFRTSGDNVSAAWNNFALTKVVLGKKTNVKYKTIL